MLVSVLRFSSHVGFFLAWGWGLFWCQQRTLFTFVAPWLNVVESVLRVRKTCPTEWVSKRVITEDAQSKANTFWITENVKKKKRQLGKLKASTSFGRLETCERREMSAFWAVGCALHLFILFSLIPSSHSYNRRSEGRSPGLRVGSTTTFHPHRRGGPRPQTPSSRLDLEITSFWLTCATHAYHSRIMGKTWTVGNGLVMTASWLRLKPSSDKYASKKTTKKNSRAEKKKNVYLPEKASSSFYVCPGQIFMLI